MPSELQRVAEGLVAALDEVPRVIGYLQRTAHRCREQMELVGGMSGNPAAQMAAMQLDEAAGRCDEAVHHLSQVPLKARAWAEQMVSGVRTAEPSHRAVGGRPMTGGGGLPPAEGRRGDDPTEPELRNVPKPAEPTADDRPGLPDDFDPHAREILERLPVRARKDRTRGIWTDPAGNEHDLVSGVDEDTEEAERFIIEEGLDIAPGDVTLGSHVEVKFAMRMRRLGLTDATIVINNRPCGGPYGCDENLEQFLPDGAKLTVYGPNNFKKTYPEPPTIEGSSA